MANLCRGFIGFLLSAGICLLVGCGGEQAYTPKPRAYPRVEFPDKTYTGLNEESCPLTFLYPSYAELSRKQRLSPQEAPHPCWFNIYFPKYEARIHCNYFAIENRQDFDELIRDSYTIANKINQRSQYMDEVRVGNPQGVTGVVMEFTGPAASPMQFFLTDTTQHFFRGALYFNTQVKPDSLAPIVEFIKQDIGTLINSFQWLEE